MLINVKGVAPFKKLYSLLSAKFVTRFQNPIIISNGISLFTQDVNQFQHFLHTHLILEFAKSCALRPLGAFVP